MPSFFGLPPAGTARDVIRAHSSGALYVDVDDPGILRDVDTPEDYRAIQSELSVRKP
jgi:CTP:molybdopterin cytidylyltransferase MocA